MNKFSVIVLIISGLLFSFCTQSTPDKVGGYIQKYLDKDLFSGVVLIFEKGNTIYENAFGFENHKKQIRNTLDTKFNIGSLNKDFTTVLILQLVEEGKLKLDDPMTNYIDGIKNREFRRITIRRLLRHESGFGDYGMLPEFHENRSKYKTVDELLELIKKQPLLFLPGSDRQYSNSGFIVLGKIIEAITGKAYGEVLQEKILTPLEMNNTFYYDLDKITNKAVGYMKTSTGMLMDTERFEEYASPAGSAFSTVHDLLKFYNALERKDKLLSDEYKKVMYTRANTDIELTWEEIKADLQFFSAKAGGLEGFNSLVLEWMAEDQIIIVLANYDEPIAEEVGQGIFDLINGKTPAEPKLPVAQFIYQTMQEKGYDFLAKNYSSFMRKNGYKIDDQWILNQVGYDLLNERRFDEAIQILSLNTAQFPNESNPYDSLGEAYMLKGDNELAIKNYEKSLALDPQNENAANKLAKLRN